VNVCVDVEVEEEDDDDRAIDNNAPLHPQWKITSSVQRPSRKNHDKEELCLTKPQQKHHFSKSVKLVAC